MDADSRLHLWRIVVSPYGRIGTSRIEARNPQQPILISGLLVAIVKQIEGEPRWRDDRGKRSSGIGFESGGDLAQGCGLAVADAGTTEAKKSALRRRLGDLLTDG